MTVAAPLLAGANIAVAVVTAGLLVVVAVMAARALRRRLRRARAALVSRAAASLDAMSSPAWWSSLRLRRQVWRSVARADRAVTAAQRADAPVGELPILCRQLRGTARLVDAQLRTVGASAAVPVEVAQQARAVYTAADHISAAVTAAMTDSVQPQLAPLVEAVRRECTALAAGTRAARRIG